MGDQMTSNRMYWVDAFSAKPYSGNPAVVCVISQELHDDQLQALAKEFNVSETAFISGGGGEYLIRWFTPTKELPLVGHATLAAAHVVLSELEPRRDEVTLVSRLSGRLSAFRDSGNLAMVLPADTVKPCDPPDSLCMGLGKPPRQVLKGRHYVAVYDKATDIQSLKPDFLCLEELDLPTIAATAPGEETDYVLRFFAPANGVPEDPVSGVAQCSLVPYWASHLSKSELTSQQLSPQGGNMFCKLLSDGVQISGPCCTLVSGDLINY
jgi:predicted PhzF superfamily epimerase YddE/YHI9